MVLQLCPLPVMNCANFEQVIKHCCLFLPSLSDKSLWWEVGNRKGALLGSVHENYYFGIVIGNKNIAVGCQMREMCKSIQGEPETVVVVSWS